MSFEARYDSGMCGNCDEPIRAGQLIQRRGEDYEHVTCPAVLEEARQPPVCPACWTTHVGECL